MSDTIRPPQPQVLNGFENINRYWDHMQLSWAAKILPGEFYVTRHAEVIATTLGSCVSACIRDRVTGLGGMNHFMLPNETELNSKAWGEAARYGNYAMEHLINAIMKAGGLRKNLEMKLVGGGMINRNMIDIGRINIEFVLDYAEIEGIEVIAQDLGDIYPRKVIYIPKTGVMRVKRLRAMNNDTLLERDKAYGDSINQRPLSGDIELF